MLKKTILALTLAALLAGCESMPKVGGDHATGGAMTGAGIGAVADNVVAMAFGGNRTIGTLAGAAIGGLIGYQQGKAQDVAEAQKLADDMATRKIPATVQSYEYRAKDEKTGELQKVSALKSIEAPLPADAIQARDIQMTGTLNKLGQFAATRSEPMVITIAGTKKDMDYLKGSIAAGVPGDKVAKVKIETVVTKTPGAKVTIRPVQTYQQA